MVLCIPECAICLEEYDRSDHLPMLLIPCLHSICKHDLNQLKTQRCPICRTEMTGTGVNKAVVELIEEITRAKEEDTLLPPTGSVSLIRPLLDRCSNHDKPKEYWCEKDKDFFCEECVIQGHRTHQIYSVEQMILKEKANCHRLAKEMGTRVENLKDLLETVKQRKVDVKATQDDLTMTIETFFDHELPRLLKARRDDLLRDVSTTSEFKLQQLEQDEASLQSKFDHLNTLWADMQVQVEDLRTDKFKQLDEIEDVKIQLRKTVAETGARGAPFLPPCSQVQDNLQCPAVYDLIGATNFLKDFVLSEGSLCVEKTIVLGSGVVHATVAQPVQFLVQLFDRDGRRKLQGGDRISVDISGLKEECHSIQDQNNGSYLVTYQVPVWYEPDGGMQVSVTIGDGRRPMPGSPFHIKLRGKGVECTGKHRRSLGKGIFAEDSLCQSTVLVGSEVYVAENKKNRITVLDRRSGEVIRRIGEGEGDAQISRPTWVASDGPLLYVRHLGKHTVQCIERVTGRELRRFGEGEGSGCGQFKNPNAVTLDNSRIYVSDFFNHRVQVFDKETGKYVQQFGGTGILDRPNAMLLDGILLYVANQGGNNIKVFDIDTGCLIRTLGDGQGLNMPHDILLLGSDLYIASYGNNRVVIIDKLTGQLKNAITSNNLKGPTSLDVDWKRGHIFVGCAGSNLIEILE